MRIRLFVCSPRSLSLHIAHAAARLVVDVDDVRLKVASGGAHDDCHCRVLVEDKRDTQDLVQGDKTRQVIFELGRIERRQRQRTEISLKPILTWNTESVSTFSFPSARMALIPGSRRSSFFGTGPQWS